MPYSRLAYKTVTAALQKLPTAFDKVQVSGYHYLAQRVFEKLTWTEIVPLPPSWTLFTTKELQQWSFISTENMSVSTKQNLETEENMGQKGIVPWKELVKAMVSLIQSCSRTHFAVAQIV